MSRINESIKKSVLLEVKPDDELNTPIRDGEVKDDGCYGGDGGDKKKVNTQMNATKKKKRQRRNKKKKGKNTTNTITTTTATTTSTTSSMTKSVCSFTDPMEEKSKSQKSETVNNRSSIVFDIMPNDIDVNMDELENNTRNIAQDGLTWKNSEVLDVAYGIKKLRIRCQVVDDKVSVDDLEERLGEMDLVQSVTILSFVNDT